MDGQFREGLDIIHPADGVFILQEFTGSTETQKAKGEEDNDKESGFDRLEHYCVAERILCKKRYWY